MTRFLLVCLGGALGSGARHLTLAIAVPYGTPLVNLIGSFAIGFAAESLPPSDLRVFVITGVLGGFTTYSSFNHETIEYARSGAWGMAVLNVAVTLLGCLAAGLAGIAIARR
jgi:CrcB protein